MQFLHPLAHPCIGLASRDVPEVYLGAAKAQKVGFKDMWNVIKGNRALQMLVIAASTDKLGSMLKNGMMIYLFSNCFLNSKMQGAVSSIFIYRSNN